MVGPADQRSEGEPVGCIEEVQDANVRIINLGLPGVGDQPSGRHGQLVGRHAGGLERAD